MTTTTCPNVNWQVAYEEGFVSTVYVEDADDLIDALRDFWDDLPIAATNFAARRIESRYFNAKTFFDAVVQDSETMSLAYDTMRKYGGDDPSWPSEWSGMIDRLVFWVLYDQFLYDAELSRENILAALAGNDVADLRPGDA